jgi:hypothetical protein
MTSSSLLKGVSTWGKADKILSGKDRGRNIIVLSFFMFALGTLVEFAGRLVLETDYLGMVFLVLGAMAFSAGLSAYLNAGDDRDKRGPGEEDGDS